MPEVVASLPRNAQHAQDTTKLIQGASVKPSIGCVPQSLPRAGSKTRQWKLFSDNHQSRELWSWFRANPPCQMGLLKPIFCSLVCWWLSGGYTHTASTGLTGRGDSFQAIPQCASLLINIFICLPLTSKLLLMRRWGILKFPRTKLATPIQSALAGLNVILPSRLLIWKNALGFFFYFYFFCSVPDSDPSANKELSYISWYNFLIASVGWNLNSSEILLIISVWISL